MKGDTVTENGKTAVSQVQSLSRGLQLIEAISVAREGLTLTELASKVGLANSTTHRLLKTIESHGFIYHDFVNERWMISGKMFHMGSAFARTRDLLQTATPVMKYLMNESGETVNICVLDGVNFDAVIIGQVQCVEIMRMVSPIGARLPVHASGAGKALLSHHDPEEISRNFKNRIFKRFNDNTITQLDEFIKELQKIKTQYYAFDNEEHVIDLRCIAVPIFDENQQIIAAVSVSGPKARMSDQKILDCIPLTQNAAKEIARRYTMI